MVANNFFCKYCGSKRSKDRFVVVESTYKIRDRFFYEICFNCESIIIDDLPKNMSQYYPDDYAPHRTKISWSDQRYFLNNLFHLRVNVPTVLSYFLSPESIIGVFRVLKIPKSAKILDFGCGSGKLVNLLHRLGFYNAIGIDPYLSTSRDIKSSFCLKQGVDDLKGIFDLIILNHSLEHLYCPLKEMQLLLEHLAYDGHLVIRCPIANTFGFRKYRESWVQLDPPRHVAIPSVEAMQIFSKNLGLVVNAFYCDGTEFQILGSEDLRKGITIMDSNSFYSGRIVSKLKLIFYRILYYRFISNLNRRNQSDQAVFILRRAS
jgi:SAM-dependent methyltransferase